MRSNATPPIARRSLWCCAAGPALLCLATLAAAEEKAGDCLGIGFEVTRPVTIAKIIADRPQVHFIKSAYDDAACPAERETCVAASYLVPGDLLLVGKTRGAYSCASYQSAADRRQNWTVGWLPSASLTPVQPALHLIAVVAHDTPGKDSLYRYRVDTAVINKVYGWAQQKHAILILDIQAGRSTLTYTPCG